MTAMTARQRIEAARSKIAASRSKGMKTYKFPVGKTLFRILPLSANPGEQFERRYGKTYLKSFDEKSFFGIIDRHITYDEPSDPIRELIFDAMRQAPDEDVKKHYRSMLAYPRYVFNALILNDPNQDKTTPVLIDVSEKAFDTIMNQFMIWSEDDENYDLAGLQTGHIFACERAGSGKDTTYQFAATPKQAPLDAKILEKVVDLDEWIKSQAEGLEQQALKFLGQVNGSVGISTTTPTALIAHAATNQTASAAPAATNMSAAAVTTQIDDDELEQAVAEVEKEVVEDAEVSPVEPEDQVQASAPASSDEDDINAVLAMLEGNG